MSSVRECKGLTRLFTNHLLQDTRFLGGRVHQSRVLVLRRNSSSTGRTVRSWILRKVYGVVIIVGVTGGGLLVVRFTVLF